MKTWIHKIDKRGDTIVEVLIAIAVLSMVLATSYGLANKSALAVRQAQERTEALKLSEEQLERLRNYVSADTGWGGNVCFAGSSPTASDSQCNFGTDNRYHITITERPVRTSDKSYVLNAVWDNAAGNGQDQIELVYRLPSESL